MKEKTKRSLGGDRFEVRSRLGAGGMGVVYEAFDRLQDKVVALKTLQQLDADSLYRFKKEFRSLADLHHPNLINLGELIEEDGQWFFTMELIRGPSFIEWVSRSSDEAAGSAANGDDKDLVSGDEDTEVFAEAPIAGDEETRAFTTEPKPTFFDEARLRKGLHQLAAGLMALHEANQIHRDIKPSNVLVTDDERVVLLDFGLATAATPDAQTQTTGLIEGTAGYMAPEQAAGDITGSPADWYAMGVTLFEALTGELPFSGPPLKVLMVKQSTPAPVPSELADDLPEDLASLCADLLKIDPLERPNGRSILERIGHGDLDTSDIAAGQSSSPDSAFFVGRQRELEILRKELERSRKGEPVALLVEGESGVGKSLLVQRFCDQLREDVPDAVVLSGRCYERESVPFKAFDGVVDALSRFMKHLCDADSGSLLPREAALLGQVFPVMRQVKAVERAPDVLSGLTLDPQVRRSRLLAAVRELFLRLADRYPVVILIDDLQWSDADSMALLDELLRQPDAPRLLTVTTMRSPTAEDKGKNHLERLPGDMGRLELGPLSREESLELATALLKGASDESSGRASLVAAESTGHPLFIDELARHAISSPLGEGGALLRLDDALRARMSRLPTTARTVLELVVVAGAPLPQRAVAAAARCHAEELGDAISQLRSGRLIQTSGARDSDLIEPYHTRVRESLLEELDSDLRASHHRELAMALEKEAGVDAEVMAVHWKGAGENERAARHFLRAADEADDAMAFERAARLYQTALELLPKHQRQDGELQGRLAHALTNAGRCADAAVEFLSAADTLKSSDDQRFQALKLQRMATEQFLISGRINEGLAACRQVLAEVGMKLPSSPGRALAALLLEGAKVRLRGLDFTERPAAEIADLELEKIDLCWSLGKGLAMTDSISGALFESRAMLLALRAGEPSRIARSFGMEACFAAALSGATSKRAADLIAATERIAERTRDPYALAWVKIAEGTGAAFAGRWLEGRRGLEEARRHLRESCTGVSWELVNCHIGLAQCLFNLGELAEFEREVSLALKEEGDRGNLYSVTVDSLGPYNSIWLMRDDPERARRSADAALESWSSPASHIEHFYHPMAAARIHLYQGSGRSAHELLLGKWGDMKRARILGLGVLRTPLLELRGTAALATAATSSGRTRRALLSEAEEYARRLSKEKMEWVEPRAALLLAGIAALRGETGRAIGRYRAAASAFEAGQMAQHAAVARWRLGELIGGDEGDELIQTSETWMRNQNVARPERWMTMLAPVHT